MKLTSELAKLKENNKVEQAYARTLSVGERYRRLVDSGFIKEEGRKVAMPGEIRPDKRYFNDPETK
jgi:hypothetical protein